MTIIQRPGTLVYICECEKKENTICSSKMLGTKKISNNDNKNIDINKIISNNNKKNNITNAIVIEILIVKILTL